MTLSKQIAKHLREVYFGGNWTASNLKDALKEVTWQQATAQIYELNTIAGLVYHMTYYATGVIKVLEGGPLDIHDKFSFDHPPINSQEDWNAMLDTIWADAEALATLIEKMPVEQFGEDMLDGKYGDYYRNIGGIIEHCHYHLGQIVVVKKLLPQAD
jgi:uncharacterized damage-inducible protein DinB